MENELFLSASEVSLCLAGSQVEKALIAACVGFKRFLNGTWQQQPVPSAPRGNALKPYAAYADALESAVIAAGLEPTGAALLIAELRLVLEQAGGAPFQDEQRQMEVLAKAQDFQQWVCSLPGQLDGVSQSNPARTDIKRALAYSGTALAAAGTIVWASTPAGVLALGGTVIAEIVKLAAGHVFGKSTDKAWDKMRGARALLPHVHCPCNRQKGS